MNAFVELITQDKSARKASKAIGFLRNCQKLIKNMSFDRDLSTAYNVLMLSSVMKAASKNWISDEV